MKTRVMMVAAVLVVFALAGCAKRPATTAASAPAPGGAGSTSPAMTAPASGPSTTASANRPAAATTARPQPSDFRATAELKDAYFDFDKYDIRPDAAKTLAVNATWLKSNSNLLVLIEGHCDERGTNEYNLALGERRAKATMNYLVAQGVAASRVSIISYGEERPVCTEHAEGCWSKNRRTHFLVKPQ